MPGKDIPTIKWTNFHDKEGWVHVAPVIEGQLMSGHDVSPTCRCGPRVLKYPKLTVVVHEIYH